MDKATRRHSRTTESVSAIYSAILAIVSVENWYGRGRLERKGRNTEEVVTRNGPLLAPTFILDGEIMWTIQEIPKLKQH